MSRLLLLSSVLVFAFVLAACGDATDPEGETIFIEVAGTVRSEADGELIPGAVVTLGTVKSGDPLTLDTDTTDELGYYQVSGALNDVRDPDDCYVWIVASAAGHRTSGIADPNHRGTCTETPQEVSVFLAPLPG